MSGKQHLLKVYSDRTYVHTTTVRHQGTTVALAMDDRRHIVYTVLDLSRHDDAKGALDAAYWSENPVPLRFPTEIADTGFAAAGAVPLPVVKRGGRIEAAAGERLDADEWDPFLSTTARLTAPVPFAALSDGTHIVILRQAVGADHPDAVHRLAGGGSSGDAERGGYVTDTAGAKVPVAADTLLCDRFLLVGSELKPVLEARYRRSRHKTRPDSAKDGLGTTDMEGRPFHEPTQHLSFVRHLSGGRFTALLVPTAVHGQQRWQVFAHNDATGRIDSFSVEQGRDGLFNLQGTQAWTSPDPVHRDAVYEPAPGTCPFTGLPLVPVLSTEGCAETALAFGEGQARVRIERAPELAGRDFTVEFWARRTAHGRQEFLVGHGDEAGSPRKSLHIGFRQDDRFTFASTRRTSTPRCGPRTPAGTTGLACTNTPPAARASTATGSRWPAAPRTAATRAPARCSWAAASPRRPAPSWTRCGSGTAPGTPRSCGATRTCGSSATTPASSPTTASTRARAPGCTTRPTTPATASSSTAPGG